ncbi:MAG: UV DNA damage repair endonuclease UvsE [Anaerolineales bacterium]|nr:UV DNA damage repair endonuclease UvsE [Anaerolineales bacterium]
MRLGYPCVSLLLGRTTNHDCTLRTATPEHLRALIAQNLADLRAILEHNLSNGWLMFRIGSSIIPFASHPVNTLDWQSEFGQELAEIGQFARQHNMRLSFHPGQYTVLNTPDPAILERAKAEIAYSAAFLDALGMDLSCKIVVHLGGVYGDREAAQVRFVETVNGLGQASRRRLVIENDERLWSPADALWISERTGLPVVFDSLHYRANPGPGDLETLLERIFATWGPEDGPPKVHFSSQALGARPGHHAEYADPEEFQTWIERWSCFGDFDLMLEAKAKDLALRALPLSLMLDEPSLRKEQR